MIRGVHQPRTLTRSLGIRIHIQDPNQDQTHIHILLTTIGIQSQISWELNQSKIGQEFRVVIDRKEGNYFVGRTEFDSPDVDNEVLIPAGDNYLRTGEYYQVRVNDAADFDLYAQVITD